MSVWAVNSVVDEPSTEMSIWAIAKIAWLERPISYHVVGYCYEGRVSSPIIQWDSENRIATTTSGRKYHLPEDGYGSNSDAEYVFDAWLRRNGNTRSNVNWVQSPVVESRTDA